MSVVNPRYNGSRCLRKTLGSALAGELGRNAAAHVRKYYTMEDSLRRLSRVLEAAVRREGMDAVRAEIEAEFAAPVGAAESVGEEMGVRS